ETVAREGGRGGVGVRGGWARGAALHRRASDWFASQGRVAEAIGHAVDGDDWHRVGRLLDAFTARPPVGIPLVPAREAIRGELVEPLTARELEVLALVAGRLTNQAIARTLRI